MNDFKFKIGEYVKIIKKGMQYPEYRFVIDKLNLVWDGKDLSINDDDLKEIKSALVIGSCTHQNDIDNIYGLLIKFKDGSSQHLLIREDGIEKIEFEETYIEPDEYIKRLQIIERSIDAFICKLGELEEGLKKVETSFESELDSKRFKLLLDFNNKTDSRLKNLEMKIHSLKLA